MGEKDQIKNIVSEAQKLRQSCKTSSFTLQNYLQYQQSKISQQKKSIWACGRCFHQKILIQKQFKDAFKKLSPLERAKFYLMNLRHVKSILDKEEQAQLRIFKSIHYESFVTKAFLKGTPQTKKQAEVNLEFFEKQKFIKIKETNEEIQLKHYLLRKSKDKQKPAIVLECCSEEKVQQSLRFSQDPAKFNSFEQKIFSLWEAAHYQKIKEMLIGDMKQSAKNSQKGEEKKVFTLRKSQSKKERETPFVPNTRSLDLDLGQKNKPVMIPIQDDKASQKPKSILKKQLIPDEFLETLTSFKDFEQRKTGIFFSKSGKKVRKIFNFPKSASQYMVLGVIDNIRHIRRRKPTVTHIKAISCIPQEQTNIYQEINNFGKETIEFLYFRHFFYRKNCSYFIEKSIDLNDVKYLHESKALSATIQYCIWRVRSNGDQLEVLVEAEISYPKQITNIQQITSLYIGEFVEYINKKCIGDINSESEDIYTDDFSNQYLSKMSEQDSGFYSLSGSIVMDSLIDQPANMSKNLMMAKKVSGSNSLNDTMNFKKNKDKEQSFINDGSLLRHKFPMEPLRKKLPKYFSFEKGHVLFGEDWIVDNQGYIVNTNIEKIKMQSSILKLIFQRMGRNLLAGKSILSMSLPIEVFNTQSNLERLAKGFKYAPLLIEKASHFSDPVQRMKYILCFSMSSSLTYIQMEKPFNPILGQTYQGEVDGNLIYGQQISHHPPISSLYMRGRGYIMYGSYQAKVQLGLNSASGLNQGWTHLNFDHHEGEVKFTGPPGELSGLIYGDRKVSMVKKTYFIDEVNRIFLQVSWGKNKNGRSGYGIYQDYFSGKIVKLKAGTNTKDYKKIKSSHYEHEYGQIYGRYTQFVYFENQQLFDLKLQLPFLTTDYVPFLESDCRLREDIIYRKANDYIKGQQAKQKLQEIQRRDRTLRKQATTIKK